VAASLASSHDIAASSDARLVTFSARSLGSVLRLHVGMPAGAAESELAGVELAWKLVLEEFDAVDVALSRFRPDSELTTFNRVAGTDGMVPVSQRLRVALSTVRRATRVTGGRFDAGVLEVLERLGERGARIDGAPAGPEPPAASRRASSLAHATAVPLDMGGIGKGLALRWAAAEARKALPAGAGLLLEAGGDLVAAGIPPSGGWLVGIEDPASAPDVESAPVAVVALDEGAVATSSIRVRTWVSPDGRPVHHLVDPRTGEPARTGLFSVTVAAPDPAWAEVWTKALFLAGRSGIASEARARGLAAWWVDDRGRLGMTPGGRMRSAWVAEDRLG
jgi:thiamine biosynthesis lipoprotein